MFKFTKMHGLGNDYVYVDMRTESLQRPSELAAAVARRHTGIGSDGLILMHPSDVADVRMEMYNADGSRAQMCGNGIRCVAKYAVEHGFAAGPEVRIETDNGVKNAFCNADAAGIHSVRVDMGVPTFAPRSLPARVDADRLVDYPLIVEGQEFTITCVGLGNPHAAIFVDDLDAVALEQTGSLIEHAPQFPERINVHFTEVASADHLIVRPWERGSGATKACGTGACAACVAGAVTGRSNRSARVSLPGGDLCIEWGNDEHVYMTGPAVEVFSGEWPMSP